MNSKQWKSNVKFITILSQIALNSLEEEKKIRKQLVGNNNHRSISFFLTVTKHYLGVNSTKEMEKFRKGIIKWNEVQIKVFSWKP